MIASAVHHRVGQWANVCLGLSISTHRVNHVFLHSGNSARSTLLLPRGVSDTTTHGANAANYPVEVRCDLGK